MKILAFYILIAVSAVSCTAVDHGGNFPEGVKKELIYSCDFSKEKDLSDWVVEGPGSAKIAGGKLIIWPNYQPQLLKLWKEKKIFQDETVDYYDELEVLMRKDYGEKIKQFYLEDKGLRGGHILFWNKFKTPENFIIEYDFKSLSPLQLHMVTFCAMGVNGEDIFDEKLKPRNGVAAQYMYGDIANYRISYFAGKRGTTNMRKAPGRNLVADGKDYAALEPDKKHRIKVVKWQDTFYFYIDQREVFKYIDNEPFGGGFWGIRLMATAKGEYDNFKVYGLCKD